MTIHSSKARARMLARAVSALIAKYEPETRAVRFTEKDLEDCAPLGIAVDPKTKEVVFALGDNPK